MGSPPLAKMQVSPDGQVTPQPQLASLLGTQLPEQQLSPSEPITGATQPVPDVPQTQWLATQLGAFGPHAVPQLPQLAALEVTSMQLPPQQAVPVPHMVPPQPHIPPEQDSPSAQAWPIMPQLFLSVDRLTHWNVLPLSTHTSPMAHWPKLPQRHCGALLMPTGEEHALARIASQASPQPLQFENDESLRPSVPATTDRFTQVVPQQRCDDEHMGEHIPGGLPSPGGGPPSPTTQTRARHIPDAHAMPQPPQLAGSSTMFLQIAEPPSSQQAWVSSLQTGLQVVPVRVRSAQPPRDKAKASAARRWAARKVEAQAMATPSPTHAPIGRTGSPQTLMGRGGRCQRAPPFWARSLGRYPCPFAVPSSMAVGASQCPATRRRIPLPAPAFFG